MDRSEQTKLRIVGWRDGDLLLRLRLRRGERNGDVVALEMCEDGLGAVDDSEWQSGKSRDLDAVATVNT